MCILLCHSKPSPTLQTSPLHGTAPNLLTVRFIKGLMQCTRRPPPLDAVVSGVANHTITPTPARHTGEGHRGNIATHLLPKTKSPPQTTGRNMLTMVRSIPKSPSFFSPAQARMGGSAPPASDATITHLPSVKGQSSGMDLQAPPGKTSREDSLWWTVYQCALTGKCQKDVPLQAIPSNTGALGAEKQAMEPGSALVQRRLKPLSLYTPKAWSVELKCLGLQDKYPSLVQGVEDGFHLGVPKILCTYTLLNHHSVNNLHIVYNNILENKFAAGQYISPFTHCQLEAELGPF